MNLSALRLRACLPALPLALLLIALPAALAGASEPAPSPASAPEMSSPEPVSSAPTAERDWGNRRLGMDFGLFTASGYVSRRDEGWAGNRDDRFSFSGPLRPDLSLWWQSAISRYYEMGVGTRLRINRTLGTEGDESEAFMQTLGTAMGIFWIHEGSIPVAPGTSIQIGLRVGGDLIFTSGDLDERIAEIRQGGFDPWKGPRGGVFVDPRVGGRYILPSAPIALRTDLGFGWERHWFWDRTDRFNGVPRDRVAYSNATVFRWSLGAEFLF